MLRSALVVLTLLAAATAGCTDKLSFSSTNESGFTVSPEKGDKDTVFQVDAGDLADGRSVTWDFGDGKRAEGKEAQHTYGFTNGIMTITLVATGADGIPLVETKTVTLGSGVNKVPTGSLRTLKTWVEVGRPANLTANANDGDRDPLTYLWTYSVLEGGGAAAPVAGEEILLDSTTSKATAIFDAPGKYAVKARVKDPKGGEIRLNTTIDVSKDIPDTNIQTTFTGRLVAGTGGAGVAEKAWTDPAPDSYADAARHTYTLDYPATTYIFLRWNDTSNASAYDLDLELRNADTGEVLFKSENHAVDPAAPGAPAPRPPIEFNFTEQAPGNYAIIVRAFAGAQVDYQVDLFATLRLTPELVAAVEGS